MFDSMCSDLAGIKKAAEEVKTYLVVTQLSSKTISNLEKRVDDLSELLSQAQEQLTVKTNELEHYCRQAQQSNKQLEEARKSQELKFSHLLETCHEKDEMITRLQHTVDQQVQATIKDMTTFDGIKDEILQLKSSCTCSRGERPSTRAESRKRLVDLQANLEDQPPSKKGFLGRGVEEMDRLHRELVEVQKDSGLLRDKLTEQKREFPKALEESEKRPLQKNKLGEKPAQQQISEQQLEVLKENLAPQKLNLEQLRAEMKAKAMAHLDSENSVAEVVTLKRKMAALEEKQYTHQTERESAVTVSQLYNDELMSQTKRVAELEKTLFEKEVQVSGLPRRLREAQEMREDETATVQEARKREVERRRELLAVAEEAITQKNAELERREQVITRLKETAKLDSDKVKSLSLDLERKDDDTSDLKEKLFD
ncbi:kinesin-like protein KIF20B isoform X2 [Salmo trutta]|nr:kinesin-like protein KIF20B isoform X2 [Salmo trutta]